MKRTKLLQRDLDYEWLGNHQNNDSKRYHVWVIGPQHAEHGSYFTDYVDNVREAKREALAHFNRETP